MNKTVKDSRFTAGHKIASVFLSAALLASTFTGLGGAFTSTSIEADAASNYGLATKVEDGNILHCFNWKLSDIKAALPQIAEAGFTSVQTSPLQSHNSSGTWYWLYQPTSFNIGNELGSYSDLQSLCTEADKYGVKVIVDVVANHLAGWNDGKWADDIDSSLRKSEYFHNEGACSNWDNRYDVTHKNIGMPDLNSENTDVQNIVAAMITKMKEAGVDGIRWDAAKHIGLPSESCAFWSKMSSLGMYNYGEILDNPAGNSSDDYNSSLMAEYGKYIGVTDATYSGTITGAIRDGNVSSSNGNWVNRGVSANHCVYWAESHDTYCNNGWTNGLSESIMDRAYAVLGARANSQALYFSRPFEKSHEAIMYGVKGSTHFTTKEVAAVNHFHNAMVGTKEYYTTGGGCYVVCRGGGAVIVSPSGSNMSVSVPNGGSLVPAGTYTDEITGNTFTVTSSTISGQIGSSGIAVVYNAGAVTKKASVSATPGDTSFTTSTLSVTLGVQNASSGTYSTSEGASGTYTNGKTITIGSSTAVGGSVTVKLSATGEDGTAVSETYTYVKKDPSAVTRLYFDNSSYNWSNVYAYIYDDGSGSGSSGGNTGGNTGGGSSSSSSTILFSDTLGWGNVYAYFFNTATVGAEWPGTQMTSNGTNEFGQTQFKITVPDGATKVVFNNGNGTQTGDVTLSGATGYYCDGSPDNVKSWVSTGSGASTTTENAAWPGTKMTLDSSTGYYVIDVPSNLVNGKVIFNDGTGSASNRYPADMEPGLAINDTTMLFSSGNSWKAYTVTPVPDPDPEVPTVTVDKASGTSFTTETLDIKLTLANAASGTYTVDGGPTKTFTGSKTVTIGEGKIGDSTVTVETTAKGSDGTTKSYTFTYNKKYVVKTTSSSASAIGGKYATNPSDQKGGKGVTITKASDFKESMIIAQGVANDDPRIFRGSHEAPVYDTYALYGAWDDTNIYLGWQFTNVTDVVDPAQGYPISDNGKPWNGDIPQMLAFDLGKGKSADMTSGNMAGGAYVWGLKVGFDTRVDALMCFSSKPGVGQPALFTTDSTGYFNYDNTTGFKAGGISFKYEDGFFGSKITGIKSNGYSGYKPADLTSSSSTWVDFLAEGHDKSQDTFYYITIPFSALGITRSYLESTGIGVMHISTFGEGGIASIPMDMTFLDNATEAYSADESTSKEKEDTDLVSVPLARLGAGTSEGGGGTPDPDPTTPLQVNFGTDKSAPQLTTTALTLKGIGIGGTAPYKYQFSVDGTVVKASNTTATYTWTPSKAGSHTIKCVITDSTGATATSSKTFTAEGTDQPDPDPDPATLVNESTLSATTVEKGMPVVISGIASGGKAPYRYSFKYMKSTDSDYIQLGNIFSQKNSETFYPHVAGTFIAQVDVRDANGKVAKKSLKLKVTSSTYDLTNTSKLNKSTIGLGEYFKMSAVKSGGQAPYTYTFMFKRAGNTKWNIIGTEWGSKTSATLTPTAEATFDMRVLIKDASGRVATKSFQGTVSGTAALANNSTLSAASGVKGTKVTVTGKAIGGTSPYKYAYYYKKSDATSWTTISAYSTNTTATFTPTAAGTYTVKVSIKDNAGTIVSKELSYKATSAAALANSSKLSATSVTKGTQITIKGAASGGTSPYKYAFYYKRSTNTKWNAIGTEFGTATSATFTPTAAATYNIKVIVKDSANATVEKTFTLKST